MVTYPLTFDRSGSNSLDMHSAHANTVLVAIFRGEPGQLVAPLIFLLRLFLYCASFWDRPKLFILLYYRNCTRSTLN